MHLWVGGGDLILPIVTIVDWDYSHPLAVSNKVTEKFAHDFFIECPLPL